MGTKQKAGKDFKFRKHQLILMGADNPAPILDFVFSFLNFN